MKGGTWTASRRLWREGVDIAKLTKLSNKYINFLFFHYNEREQYENLDPQPRSDAVEQYMEDIEREKKPLKRFFAEVAHADDGEEIFTDESIRYVAKIDNQFGNFKTRNPNPEAAELSDITLTEDQVNKLYNSLGGGALKKRGKKTPKLKRKKKGKTNNKGKVSKNKKETKKEKVRVRRKVRLTKRNRKGSKNKKETKKEKVRVRRKVRLTKRNRKGSK